jgi:hypothetical protein
MAPVGEFDSWREVHRNVGQFAHEVAPYPALSHGAMTAAGQASSPTPLRLNCRGLETEDPSLSVRKSRRPKTMTLTPETPELIRIAAMLLEQPLRESTAA